MRGRDAHLGLLLISVTTQALIYITSILFVWPEAPYSKPDFLQLNSEARLAFGKRIALKFSDPYDLELIPGIADTYSSKIVLRREDILHAAAKLKDDEKFKALEIVHGIGAKTALKFSAYLCLDDKACF